MTFKNIKFDDSVVMRSFARVAKEKKLIIESEKKDIVKTAKNNLFYPTNNFQENIIKLCEGLRVKGFSKLAEDLESNFLNYKKAENLYNAIKETGEDLVDEAHPDGSHTVEDVEGDAVVETIVDQKSKIEKVVNKKPTGKLAARQQEKKNKISLAQPAAPEAASFDAETLREKRKKIHNIILGNVRDTVNKLIQISEQIDKDIRPKEFKDSGLLGTSFTKSLKSLVERDMFGLSKVESLEKDLSDDLDESIKNKDSFKKIINDVIEIIDNMINFIKNDNTKVIEKAKESYIFRIEEFKKYLLNTSKLLEDNVYNTIDKLPTPIQKEFSSEYIVNNYLINYSKGLLTINAKIHDYFSKIKNLQKTQQIKDKYKEKLLNLLKYTTALIKIFDNIKSNYMSPIRTIKLEDIKNDFIQQINTSTDLSDVKIYLIPTEKWNNLEDFNAYINKDIFDNLNNYLTTKDKQVLDSVQ